MEGKCPPRSGQQWTNQVGGGEGSPKTTQFATDGTYNPAPMHQKCFTIERGMPEGQPQSTCCGILNNNNLPSNNVEIQDPNCTIQISEEKTTKDDCSCPPPTEQAMEGAQESRLMPEHDPKLAPQFQEGERLADKIPCICPGGSPREAPYETPPSPEHEAQSVAVKAAVHSSPEADEKPPKGVAPCYLSQLRKAFAPPEAEEPRMGVIGPWATGVVEWGPTSGITGVRPVADMYSVTGYSEAEWKKRNADILKGLRGEVQHACNVDFGARECAKLTGFDNDRTQHNTTKKLAVRTKEVYHWKTQLEHSINLMAEELNLMETMRQKLKNSMGVCRMPESISSECLTLRAARLEPDLVKDTVEIELQKERSLVNEVHDLMERMLRELEEQEKRDKTVKAKLEMDWSDKKESYDIETVAVNLKLSSPNIMWKPGSVQFTEGQPSLQSWEHTTKENLHLLELERSRSVELRNFLESFTNDMARDLLTQAARVDNALANKVADLEATKQLLEDELKKTLKRIVDTEQLIVDIKLSLRNMDKCVKKAQTRLSSRELRPRTENCRDDPQYALIAEVKSIEENIAAMKSQLRHAEESMSGLLTARGDLERDIMVKRKSLLIDRDRLQRVRAQYPSATSLSGY